MESDPPVFEATTEKVCVVNGLVGVPENRPVLVLNEMPAAKRVEATDVLTEYEVMVPPVFPEGVTPESGVPTVRDVTPAFGYVTPAGGAS
jgi:hypothetical protein